MQYYQLRILCALRDKIAENDTSLPVTRLWTGPRADDTLGFRIA